MSVKSACSFLPLDNTDSISSIFGRYDDAGRGGASLATGGAALDDGDGPVRKGISWYKSCRPEGGYLNLSILMKLLKKYGQFRCQLVRTWNSP